MLTRRTFISGGAAALALSPTSRLFAQRAGQISFNDRGYFFRWTNGRQFEFTPQGQENLDRWTDMVTIVVERDRGTPDLLAEWASNLASAYREKGVVLRTSSVPATPQKPAQHFISAVVADTGLVESTFTRFLLMQGIGYAFIYSYRLYGADQNAVISQMSDWVIRNGAKTEATVMAYAPVPDIGMLQKWQNMH